MNDKLELDIPVLLPDLPDAADACLDRLVSTLSKREGVERAHVICLDGDTPAALCIHFDAAKLPLPRLREMVRAAGAEITERYGHAIWQVTGISHERRARTVSDALCALPGVVQASASTSGSVRVEYDRRETTEEEVRAALRKLKVRVGKRVAADDHAGHDHGPGGHDAGEEKHGPGDGHDHSHAEFLGPNTELIFALACGALLGIGYAIEGWLPAHRSGCPRPAMSQPISSAVLHAARGDRQPSDEEVRDRHADVGRCRRRRCAGRMGRRRAAAVPVQPRPCA
jgi:Cd2+/Zn2+-exporting ATPase